MGPGFMRCETAIADDAWFFDGHFKNDPCMPGNFMVEACIEATVLLPGRHGLHHETRRVALPAAAGTTVRTQVSG